MTTATSTPTTSPPSFLSGLGRAIAARIAWLPALITAVITIPPTSWALWNQTFGIFGRDQGIFQYVAWALRHGDRAYRDIHEINGPLPHAWHIAMQLIGGEDEHVFRSIDTCLLVFVYALGASTIPQWAGVDLGDEDEGSTRRRFTFAWVLAGIGVLGSQYTRFDWWSTTQREALYSMMLFGSIALQSLAHRSKVRPRAFMLFAGAAMLSSLTWFGKPPCAVFAVLQLLVLWLDRKEVDLPGRPVGIACLLGVLVSALMMFSFLLAYSDIGEGLKILANVPKLHHTIWNKSLVEIYRAYNNRPRIDWALATLTGWVAAYHFFKMPRRALLGAVLPIGGMAVFIGQGKAFPYHLHMVTLGTAVMQLMILAGFVRYVQSTLINPPKTKERAKLRERAGVVSLVVAIAAVLLGVKAAQDTLMSPGVQGRWAKIGSNAEKRASKAYVNEFGWGDYFANDQRDAAAYLAFHTRPDERVQTYGFDPYLLFLARRKSASPILYVFELNVDAALEGGSGAKPSAELATWLRTYRDDTEKLVLHAVEIAPPAAFVLFDRAPFSHPFDSDADFAKHCPDLHKVVVRDYVESAIFGTIRVWLRRDVKDRPFP
jgi:hypothetical protein